MDSPQIRIHGWRPGAKTVSLTMTIRHRTGLGLVEAKRMTDRILAGDAVVVTLAETVEPTAVLAELAELGFSAELIPLPPKDA